MKLISMCNSSVNANKKSDKNIKGSSFWKLKIKLTETKTLISI